MEYIAKVTKTKYTYSVSVKRSIIDVFHEVNNIDPEVQREKIIKVISDDEFEILNNYTDEEFRAFLFKKKANNSFNFRFGFNAEFSRQFNLEKGQEILINYNVKKNSLLLKRVKKD